ncbi:MAG TPA: DUF4326 domain-containing protein [Longimicrobium sp.]|jgi:hypothetical protein
MCTTHTSADGQYRVLVVRRGYSGASTYIGRLFQGERGSVLANPRSLRDGWERGETLVHYERELRAALDRGVTVATWNGRVLGEGEREAMRAEMNRLFAALRERGVLALRCFCAPLACHGDVIARLLLEKLEAWLAGTHRPAAAPDPVLGGLLEAAGGVG